MNYIGRKYKILSFLLTLTILLSSFITVNASTNTSDINGHWGEEVLQKWIDLGLLGGYGNGQYRPNASITRAEFVTLLNKMNNNTEMSDKISQYKDVEPSDWYYSEISKALAAGYINGTSTNTISPIKAITREEAAAILLNYEGIKPQTDQSILSLAEDGLSTSNWAKDFMAAAMEEGYISGSNSNIYPQNNLTRAEAVTLLDKMLTDTRTYSFPTTYGPKKDTKTVSNVVIDCPGTTLQNMTIDGDIKITEDVGEGEVTLDNVKVKGNVYVNGGGINTVLFNNVDVVGALVVNKLNGKVRILATGNTNISVTTLSSGAILVERELTGGGFEQVTIPADVATGQDIVIEGNVNKLENYASSIDLTINGKVNEVYSSTDLSVKGKAEVAKTTGESTIKTPDAKTEDKPSSGGSSSSSDSDSDDSDSSISVQSVKINGDDMTLLVGETKTFTATISPSNATNKNIQWLSSDPSVAAVDSTGKVQAVSVGTATITAKTVSGGKTDSVTVTVTKKDLSISFSSLSGLNLSEISHGNQILDQSKYFDFKGISSTVEKSVYVASYVYDVTNVTVDIPFPIVVTLKEDGKSITAGEDTTVRLTPSGNDSEYYSFGEYLKDGYKDGSFLLLLDLSKKIYTLQVSDERYNDIKTTIHLIPSNKPIINKIGEITGTLEAGKTLTAGEVKADGNSVTSNITYQWYVSDQEGDNYKAISGANSSTYTIKEADSGKYFRVMVSGDGEHTFGYAISNAYGPVKQTINTDDIFAEIASAYLGENTDANYVSKALNLMTSLSGYPGVSIEWSSDNGAVNPLTGAITRGEDDVVVKLTATINGTTNKEFEVKVLSEKVENVGQTGTDPRFVPGYPRAFVKDGTIHVEFKTISDEKAYIIVNGINGHQPSSVEGVLGGYGGDKDALIYIDSWPYFETKANELISFDTGISVTSGGREKRIGFVLKDMDDSDVGDLVTILFDKATLAALDQTGPMCNEIKISRDGSKIYIYFYESITTTGLSTSDFSLTKGEVTGIVETKNFDASSPFGASCLVLSVSGVDTTSKLSYIGGSIKDISIYENQAEHFSNKEIQSADTVITDVIVGNDGKHVMVEMTGGPNSEDSKNVDLNKNDFVISTANGNKIPSSMTYSFNLDWISYELTFEEALVINPSSKVTVNMKKDGLFDYAYDTYTAPLEKVVTDNLSGITDKTPLSVTYNQSTGQFKMIFDSSLKFENARFADNFVVSIDGIEYGLRGQLLRPQDNEVVINLLSDEYDNYSKKIKDLLSSASSVKIKYELIHGDNRSQLLDIGAALLPAFNHENVTIN